jgi:ornithine decarboxylase
VHRPAAWESYIREAADIARNAGVTIARLNVGGGFPNHRLQACVPQIEATFQLIDRVTTEAFGADRPLLVCEPGRALAATPSRWPPGSRRCATATHVFLNDGVYGALTELPMIGVIDRMEVLTPDGDKRGTGRDHPAHRLWPDLRFGRPPAGRTAAAVDIAEGDFVICSRHGAYSTVTNTRFNGFGDLTPRAGTRPRALCRRGDCRSRGRNA